MNKLFLIVLIFFTSFKLFGQSEGTFTITSVSYKIPGESWVKEEPLNSKIVFNEKIKRIQVYTKKIQIIDYVGFESLSDDNLIFGSFATDSDYNKIYIKFLIEEKFVYFIIEYGDISIKYKLAP